jgi:glycosyltransferase involved in cell wall biosynthesis
MKIAFVVAHATQFEVPFYRFVFNHDYLHELHVFYLHEPANRRLDAETGITLCWEIDLPQSYRYTVLSQRLPQDILHFPRNKFDLVILNGYKGFFRKLATRLKTSGFPIALRMDTVTYRRSWLNLMLRRIFLGRIYASFDQLLVTGSASGSYLAKMGIGREKIGIFPYGIDRQLFLSNGTLRTRKIILVVAKLISRESPEEVIDAFALLNDASLTLIIIGEGKRRSYLEKRCRKYPNRKIIFTGYVPYRELPKYYRQSILFVHAARYEPWGVSVHEAISSGCRVVCSGNVGAAHDLVKPGRNGFIYRSGRVNELADCIIKSLRIPERIVVETNRMLLKRLSYRRMWEQILHTAASVSKPEPEYGNNQKQVKP